MSVKKAPFFPDTPWIPGPSSWKGTWREDWRIMGQEGYLLHKHLQHRKFDRVLVKEDYDCCEFCFSKFDKDPEHPLNAFFCPENKVWICEECYNDFKKFFDWTVEECADPEQ